VQYWLAFAAFFSSYDEARRAAHAQGPSFFADLAGFLWLLPAESYAYLAPRLVRLAHTTGVGHSLASRYLPPPAPGSGSVGTVCSDLLARMRTGGGGGLAGVELVTAGLLVSSCALPSATAIALMEEAIHFNSAQLVDSSGAQAAYDRIADGEDDAGAKPRSGLQASLLSATSYQVSDDPLVTSPHQQAAARRRGGGVSGSAAAAAAAATAAAAAGGDVATELAALRAAVASLSAQLAGTAPPPRLSPGVDSLLAAARETVLQRQASGVMGTLQPPAAQGAGPAAANLQQDGEVI